MPDDRVKIDPEFLAPPRRTGQSRWALMGAVAATAFMLGWLLRSPTPTEPGAVAMSMPTTVSTQTTTALSRPPTTTTTTTVAATVGMGVPLGEAVPGFADAVTMTVSGGIWGEEMDIVRWRPSQPEPETVVSFREGSPYGWEWFAGLDAAGTWYATQDQYDVLSVRPVAEVPDEEAWWEPTREVVGIRVIGVAWHDTSPGRLAWLSCLRAHDGPAALHTLDVADRSAEPVFVGQFSDACGESAVWIDHWGDWGFALGRMGDWVGDDDWDEGPPAWTVLLDPNGAELAELQQGPGGADMVGAGPGGTVWNEEPMDGAPTSFLLSLDGQQRTAISGVSEGEWIHQARWSPDGSSIALVILGSPAAQSSIRIVDAAAGEIVSEIEELGPIVFETCWSSDGRYLLVGHDRDEYGAAGAALVVYDTATAGIAIERPLPERHYFREIRTFEPSSIVVEFTPVAWDIALEESWGPGVYTLRMVVDASPLLPDQLESLSGKLVWADTVVDLCNIGVDDAGGSFVQFGDTFQTIEGCGENPTAMQDAFDQFGLPDLACLLVASGGVEHEYCAPLS